MSDAYDLRSNIKGKQGSQGTLFQVKDKGLLNPQQRWPQGYTPERLNEVRDALKNTRVKTFKGPSEAPIQKWEDLDREHLSKTVAHTNVPADDLRGLNAVNTKITNGAYAEYRPGRAEIGWGLQHPDPDKNLVHEIGHHVDSMRAGTAEKMEGTSRNLIAGIASKHAEADWQARGKKGAPNGTALANAVQKVSTGVGEGYADNYYVKHYKGPGRKGQTPTQGRYEDIQGDHLEAHYPGYRDVRPESPSRNLGPQFEGMNKIEHILDESIGREDANGQRRLF